MARKISKEAYELIIRMIKENGSMSTDEVVELARPHYDFDPRAARERELRRYVGTLMRRQRDESGARTMFLEKKRSEIIDIEHCDDLAKLTAVASQLRANTAGSYRSYRKAAKRKAELEGQVSMFDEMAFVREMIYTTG